MSKRINCLQEIFMLSFIWTFILSKATKKRNLLYILVDTIIIKSNMCTFNLNIKDLEREWCSHSKRLFYFCSINNLTQKQGQSISPFQNGFIFPYCRYTIPLWLLLQPNIDTLHIMGMQPIWRIKQKKFSLLGIEIYSHVKKPYCSVLQMSRMCKGPILLFCSDSMHV